MMEEIWGSQKEKPWCLEPIVVGNMDVKSTTDKGSESIGGNVQGNQRKSLLYSRRKPSGLVDYSYMENNLEVVNWDSVEISKQRLKVSSFWKCKRKTCLLTQFIMQTRGKKHSQ